MSDSIEFVACNYTDSRFLRTPSDTTRLIVLASTDHHERRVHDDRPAVRLPAHRSWQSQTGTRLPGWAEVTTEEWASAQWQRAHCVKNIRQLRQVIGAGLDERFYADLERDQAERATMSMLVPPQMINTMVPDLSPRPTRASPTAFYADPVRRYMIPVFSDRRADWPSHPEASRDSLHEAEMWAVEGLTHRYPTKVLAELLPTCPQYCGHCTRMDLVGNPTAADRQAQVLARP